VAGPVHAESAVDRRAQTQRRPATYLAIFQNGYGGDPLPEDPAEFEELLKVLRDQGHFNAILCKYSPQREALCKEHSMRMVVDLLADGHHVYRNPKECEALLKTLRGNDTVVAYHLWSDRFNSKN